jgi:hypothetical protein
MMLKCDMNKSCFRVVTHVDEKGFVYCYEHGRDRRAYCRSRLLSGAEIKTLKAGGSIRYRRK